MHSRLAVAYAPGIATPRKKYPVRNFPAFLAHKFPS